MMALGRLRLLKQNVRVEQLHSCAVLGGKPSPFVIERRKWEESLGKLRREVIEQQRNDQSKEETSPGFTERKSSNAKEEIVSDQQHKEKATRQAYLFVPHICYLIFCPPCLNFNPFCYLFINIFLCRNGILSVRKELKKIRQQQGYEKYSQEQAKVTQT